MKKLTTITLLTLVLSNNMFGRKLYSIQNGGYSTSGTWSTINHSGASCGCTPTNSDTTYIGDNDSVYYSSNMNLNNGAGTPKGVVVEATGILAIVSIKDLTVKSGALLDVYGKVYVTNDMTINTGSVVIIRSGSLLIVGNNFENKNNSDGVTINGAVSVIGNFTNGAGADIAGSGIITVTGTNTNSGTVFSSGVCGSGNCTYASGLPIELISFSSTVRENNVSLAWITASETNNAYFLVEKSQGGFEYSFVRRISGNGNSSQAINYETIDNTPFSGTSYYRLTQVDFDGTARVVSIISVEMANTNLFSVFVYPSPVQPNGAIRLSVNFDSNENVVISITDINGKTIYSENVGSANLQNNVIPQNLLKSGIYFVTASSSSKTSTAWLVVQ